MIVKNLYKWVSYKSLGALAIALASATAAASDNGLVISQVYGSGGNAGAPFRNDFVELFNASNVAISLNGFSVQYASATGTGNFGNNPIINLPNITLQAGQYFLVQQASGGAAGNLLPTADASGTVNMSGTNGKVVLVNTTAGLACNGGSAACSVTDQAKIIDLIGFGNANFFEGAAASVLSTSTAAVRSNNGCTDSNNNASDFSALAPAPRNTSSALNVCGGGSNPVNQAITTSCPALAVSIGAGGSTTLTATDPDGIVNGATQTSAAVAGLELSALNQSSAIGQPASLNLTVAPNVPAGNYAVTVNFTNNDAQNASCTVNVSVQAAAAVTRIYTIQGSDLGVASVSLLNGSSVTTEGVVTAKFAGLSGFYLQDEIGDNNPLTSDGIFVFGSSALASVNVGDKIRLNANVTEFNTITELVNPSNIQILSSNNPVLPTDITLPETTEGDLEAYEGMLVRITTPLTVSQNYFQGRYGQVSLSAGGRLKKPSNIFRPNTFEAAQLADQNARSRITLDDGSSAQNPNPIPFIGEGNTLRAGDVVQTVTGVIEHGLITASSTGPRDYKINPTINPEFSRENPRTAVPNAVGGNIKVASFNVLNYFTTFVNGSTASGQTGQGCSLGNSVAASNCRGANNALEFTRQRDKIINAIAAINADAVGLMEIQSNGAVAVQNLVDGLNAKLGAGTYSRVNDPVAGTGTDAIKVAMIYKPAKLSLVGAALSDTNSINNRPTLAQTFAAANGEKFSVLVNHFKSKSCGDAGGVDADQNDGQGCYNAQRQEQAIRLASGFIPQVIAAANDADVLVIGDLNSYGKEDPIALLNDKGLSDQIARFNGDEGYSYVFDGESGYLDHALANASMAAQITHANQWHINADEPFVIDYNTEFKPQDLYTNGPYKASDHDPVIIGLSLKKAINGSPARDTITGTAGDDVINAGEGADTITTGAGNDVIVYQSMRDAMDTVNDFTPNADRIDLSTLLAGVGYTGSNPFVDGYAKLVNINGGVSVQIDVDGSGAATATYRPIALLKNLSVNQLDVVRDFAW
ncbi:MULTISPECIES: ExeM/NucH family extracellular endonuclease [Methylotenera]|uniref:ExeM/NucH family extracellular endonuclease n=1 Tax=Methylotenera TaxID=359407 RepID=UPI000367457B|nr:MULTISPECIES: ExeM/NucH family extracellular endonuclease [Methylotenera]